MPFPAQPDEANDVIFTRLAAEVDRCATMAADLQDVLGAAPRDAVTRNEIRGVQSLDLLEQMLRDLAAVLTVMSEGRGAANLSVLAQTCKLDDVARRLQGLPTAAHDDDVDIF